MVRGHPLPHGATEQVADPHPECLARGVPTGDVDGGLGVEVSHEAGVHRCVDPPDLGRIEAQQAGCQFDERSPGAEGVLWLVGAPQWAGLAEGDRAVVADEHEDGRVEVPDVLERHPVGGILDRQFVPEDVDLDDLHRWFLRSRTTGRNLAGVCPVGVRRLRVGGGPDGPCGWDRRWSRWNASAACRRCRCRCAIGSWGLTHTAHPDERLAEVELALLLFFVALFVVVGGVEHSQFLMWIGQFIQPFVEEDLLMACIVLMWASAFLSAAIDNIPFTAAMIPIILGMEAQGITVTPLWWALALGVGMGGNGSHLGSTANVFIVTLSERIAKKEGDPSLRITPMEWFKHGTPVMILTLIIASIVMITFFPFYNGPLHQ